MQPQPLIRGAIVLARTGPNFECLLACREWHALELTRSTNESRIQADCDWVPTCSNTPLHVLKKSQKKSCHTHGNCYKRRNSSSFGRIHAKIYAISARNFTVSFAVNFSGRVNAACRFQSACERRLNPFLRFRRSGHATLPRGSAVQHTGARDRRGDDDVPRQWNTWGPVSRRQYHTRGGYSFERASGCPPEPYRAGYP